MVTETMSDSDFDPSGRVTSQHRGSAGAGIQQHAAGAAARTHAGARNLAARRKITVAFRHQASLSLQRRQRVSRVSGDQLIPRGDRAGRSGLARAPQAKRENAPLRQTTPFTKSLSSAIHNSDARFNPGKRCILYYIRASGATSAS